MERTGAPVWEISAAAEECTGSPAPRRDLYLVVYRTESAPPGRCAPDCVGSLAAERVQVRARQSVARSSPLPPLMPRLLPLWAPAAAVADLVDERSHTLWTVPLPPAVRTGRQSDHGEQGGKGKKGTIPLAPTFSFSCFSLVLFLPLLLHPLRHPSESVHVCMYLSVSLSRLLVLLSFLLLSIFILRIFVSLPPPPSLFLFLLFFYYVLSKSPFLFCQMAICILVFCFSVASICVHVSVAIFRESPGLCYFSSPAILRFLVLNWICFLKLVCPNVSMII